MAYLIVFLLIAAAMALGTIRLIVRDGSGPQRPPVSHLQDPRFQAPSRGVDRQRAA